VNSQGTANVCWVISDGRAGILNQGLGLAEAVGLPVEVKTVHPHWPWTWLPVTAWPNPFRSLGSDSANFAPPWPRLAIGCGWRSIPFVLAIKRLSQGRSFTVQLQDPRIAPTNFDLVVPPQHDQLTGPNVISTLGSPNRISKRKLDEAAGAWRARFDALPAPHIGVLIGGQSKAHRFTESDAQRLSERLKALTKDASLIVTPSRRTGEAQTKIITRALEGTRSFVWDGTGENPYFAILALSDAFLVTSDSTNLLTEAAASGKPVHIIEMSGGNAKFERLYQSLIDRGIARRFTGQIETWSYPPLNETARIATEIRQRLRGPTHT
jgi:mitochondrial fission protein ELM1